MLLLWLLMLLLLWRFVLRALLLSGEPLPGDGDLNSAARLLDQDVLAEGPIGMWG